MIGRRELDEVWVYGSSCALAQARAEARGSICRLRPRRGAARPTRSSSTATPSRGSEAGNKTTRSHPRSVYSAASGTERSKLTSTVSVALSGYPARVPGEASRVAAQPRSASLLPRTRKLPAPPPLRIGPARRTRIGTRTRVSPRRRNRRRHRGRVESRQRTRRGGNRCDGGRNRGHDGQTSTEATSEQCRLLRALAERECGAGRSATRRRLPPRRSRRRGTFPSRDFSPRSRDRSFMAAPTTALFGSAWLQPAVSSSSSCVAATTATTVRTP